MRLIPTALQTHRDTLQTTQCYLLKIAPVNGTAFGVTSLDQDVDYDDGGGSLTYSSAMGLNLSSVEASSSLSVNNAEAVVLMGAGLTREDITAGVLDYAPYWLYRINWADTSQGHELRQSGKIGNIRSSDDLAALLELRSLSQQLKQNFIDFYSRSCRARFGSTSATEAFPCNFDAASLLQALTVSTVGSETDRIFTASGSPSASGPNGALPFVVAQITFTSGANNGLTVETETVSGAVITLRFPAPYPIEVGDTFNIRPDCQKRYAEDCIAHFDNHLNFRGEPWIPITEEAPGQFPGANVKGQGGTGSTPTPVPDDSPTPPDTPPDLTGAVTWESWFGRPFGSAMCDATRVIPQEGIAIWFQVPDTADNIDVDFLSVEVTGGITSTVAASVNTGVLDFTTAPFDLNMGLGDKITYGINNALPYQFTPGNVYILNIRNNEPNDPNWRRFRCTYN